MVINTLLMMVFMLLAEAPDANTCTLAVMLPAVVLHRLSQVTTVLPVLV